MGNSTQKKTNDLLDRNREQTDSEYSGPLGDTYNRSKSAYDAAGSHIQGLRGGFQGFADTGGIDEGFSLGGVDYGGEAGSVGPYDEARFAKAISGYEDFAGSGGGVDAEGIRARSNRAIPQFYKNLENESKRRRMINPYAPSFDAEQQAMARQAGQQTQENIRDTETNISEMIRQGRLAGLGGLERIHGGIAEGKQRGDIVNAQIGESAAGRRLSASQSGQNNALQLQGMKQQGRLSGLSGLAGLYSSENQDAKDYMQMHYGGMGDRGGQRFNSIAARQSGGSDWWKKALAGAGSAAMYGAFAASSRKLKTDIKPLTNEVSSKLKGLSLYKWKYKGDTVDHMGPMAEEFKDTFGVGDGKTLHLADVMGVVLASQQEALRSE